MDVQYKLLQPELFFLVQAFYLFCINRLQGEVYLKEGDFSNVSRYSGCTIFRTINFQISMIHVFTKILL